MVNKASRAEIREKKHRRLRHHLNGTATTPRLAVFRSNKHMYAQIIDDTVGKTLGQSSNSLFFNNSARTFLARIILTLVLATVKLSSSAISLMLFSSKNLNRIIS